MLQCDQGERAGGGEQLDREDLPQAVDIVANPSGPEFLARDCRNVCRWFSSHGLPVDDEALFAELLSHAW